MPSDTPGGAGGAPLTPVDRSPAGADRWFWDDEVPETDGGGDPVGPAHLEPLAVLGALVGALGLGSLLLGQGPHRGGPVDLVVALLAVAGTLAALVIGRLGLVRLAIAGPSRRGRGLAFLGLAEGWLSVLLVLVFGLHAVAGP